MLLLVRTSAGIRDKPRLKSSVEGAACRGITTAIRHHTTNHDLFDILLFQYITKICVDERIVGVLSNSRTTFRFAGNFWYHFPISTANSNRSVRAPFAHELVFVWRRKLFFSVAVLGEDAGHGFSFEMVDQFEDVGKGGRCHFKENMLHIDYEKSCGHILQLTVYSELSGMKGARMLEHVLRVTQSSNDVKSLSLQLTIPHDTVSPKW